MHYLIEVQLHRLILRGCRRPSVALRMPADAWDVTLSARHVPARENYSLFLRTDTSLIYRCLAGRFDFILRIKNIILRTCP